MNTRCTDRKNHKLQTALSWVAQNFFFFFFYFNKKKRKKEKRYEGEKTRKVYQHRAWKLNFFFFTKTTLVLSNTPNTNGFTYERGIQVKI